MKDFEKEKNKKWNKMIKTKSVYDPVDPGDGCRILIMRKWPRGIGYKKHAIYKWSKELGPSKGLLEKWNNKEITWRDYVKKYSAEQASPHTILKVCSRK
jgi:uncharacterized protein YeaO (DUF488 family)